MINRVAHEYRPQYKNLMCECGDDKDYSISMHRWNDDQINDSSFRRETAKNIVLHVYKNILDDSLKYYITDYKITLGNFESPDSLKFNVYRSIKKSDIERFLGNEVITGATQGVINR